MAEILRVIEPISNQKFIRRIKTNELRFVFQTFRDPFMKQRTYLKRPRLPLLQYSHQTIQSAARINDVFHQQYVLSFQPRFGVINQVHRSARDRPIAIARRHEKIDLKRAADLPYEIAEKDETSFEQTEHQQLAVGISRGNLAAELGDAARDGRLVESDPFYSSSRQPRVALR